MISKDEGSNRAPLKRTTVYVQRWVAKNLERHQSYQRQLYVSRYTFLAWLKSAPCFDCGNCFPPECMDFDHREGEKKRFTVGAGLKYSAEVLTVEIVKCDLVCSNCHRIRTFARKRRG